MLIFYAILTYTLKLKYEMYCFQGFPGEEEDNETSQLFNAANVFRGSDKDIVGGVSLFSCLIPNCSWFYTTVKYVFLSIIVNKYSYKKL